MEKIKKPRSAAQRQASAKWYARQRMWKAWKYRKSISKYNINSYIPKELPEEKFSSEYSFSSMYYFNTDDEYEMNRLTFCLLEKIVNHLKSMASSWRDYLEINKSYIGQQYYYVRSLLIYNANISMHDYTMMDKLDVDCRMTLKEFIDCCKVGAITDSDGCGVYATEDMVISNLPISPTQVCKGWNRTDFKYICWYNK